MIIFITHPKYFNQKDIDSRNDIELIYIFDSYSLYKKLSKNYKCVNLDKKGKIKNENYFPEVYNHKEVALHNFFRFKTNILKYFRKKLHIAKKRNLEMLPRYRDVQYDIYIAFAKRKKNYNDKFKVLDEAILKTVNEILELEHGEEYLEQNRDYIELLFNYSNSFQRAYVYSFCDIRGMEVFTDIIRFSYFLKVILYYRFNKFDIYEDGFHYSYLKVLCRLFIETIHQNDIKKYIFSNIKLYKENEWL